MKNTHISTAGASLLVVGCFLPILHAPIIGSISYTLNGGGDGVIVAGLGLFGGILALGGLTGWAAVPAALSLAIITNALFAFANVGLPKVVTLGIGWPVMYIGALAMLVAAFLPGQRKASNDYWDRSRIYGAEPQNTGFVYPPCPGETPIKTLIALLALVAATGGARAGTYDKAWVGAYRLYRAYDQNPIAADAKYRYRIMTVAGPIDHIGRDISGDPYIVLAGSADEYRLGGVQCAFGVEHEAEIAALSKGQRVYISGEIKGLIFLSVHVVDCEFTAAPVLVRKAVAVNPAEPAVVVPEPTVAQE